MGIILEAVVSQAISERTKDRIPVVRSLIIGNDSDEAIDNVRVIIHPEPSFSNSKVINVKRIGKNERIRIKNADLVPNGEFLAGVTERIDGTVTVSVEADGKKLAEKTYNIAVLAKDEWFGTAFPESISAFISSDDPEIFRIAANAARFLETWTGDAVMHRYASGGRKRVRAEINAIYGAMQQFDIRGTALPKEWKKGCRISSAAGVIEQNSATPLDLTLIMMSCAESVGLNTVLILTKGRVTAGIWTDDMTFSEPIVKDAALLTRYVRDGSLMLVDCEGVTSNRRMDIESSETSAKRSLLDESELVTILDVKCLGGDARPFSARTKTAAAEETADERPLPEPAADNVLTRRERWEKRLLDLSFNNELLSMRLNDTLLPVMTNNLAALKEALTDGKELKLTGRPAEWDAQIMNETPFELSRYVGRHEVLIEQEFRNRTLRTPYNEKDMNRRLENIHKISKADIEKCENSLYIIYGVLKWHDTDNRTIYAPLVMVPAETVIRSSGDEIKIKAKDDEATINRTLIEKLRRSYDIDISVDPLPSDRTGVDTERVFAVIKNAIRTMDGWDVIEGAFIGIFRPETYDIWNDLRGRSDLLFTNKLTKSLMEGKLAWNPVTADADRRRTMLVYDADGSQRNAVRSSSNGTFIMNAPAGTGRNETICNMISDAVYSGRTVLFVSENDASLASVKERMGEAGIGRMCLHLNSGNADKKRVLDHFRNVTDSACRSYVDGYRSVSDDIDKMYNDLSSTLLSLHRMTNSGVSIFDVMMRYNNVRDKKAEIIEFPEKLIVSAVPGSTEKWEGMVGDLITAARTLGHPSEHPLSDTGITEFNPETADAVTNALNEWIGAAEDAEESLMSLLSSVELNDTADADGLAGSLLDLGAIPKDIAGSASATRTSEMIHELSEAVTSSFGVFVEMSGRLGMNTIEDGIRIAEEHHDRMRSALDGLIDIRIPDADTGLIEKYANDILAVKERMLASLTLLKEARKEWKDPALSLDTRDLMRRWKEIAGKRLFSGGAKKAFVKELSEYMKNGDATFDSLPSYVRSVENYISAMNEIKRSLSSLDVSDSTYGSLADSVRSLRKTYEITRSKLNALKEHGDADKICEIFSCGPEVEKNASRYIAARKELSSKRRSVEDLLITNISKITDNDTIEEWKALAEKWAGNMNRAEEITAWNKCRKALADEGLECVANAYVNGMDHDTVMPSFIVSLNKYLMDSYISREPSLSKFDRTAFEENAARFREMSGTFAEMSRAELKAVAASRVYDVISEERPEIVSLKNMIATAGRGITIRSLLSEIKGMMSAVCPCMMMSPSSVSRYLDHNVSFDLVIIDSEQMMTHRAVDLMTRGKEVVIAGDIMRPPGVTASNAEKDDLMNDCLSVQMPVLGLEWNYRPEKLTEFTNSYFYGTRMRTFPPAIKEGPRIAVTYSDGTYDRTSKRNDTEAEAVVRYVMDRLKEGKGRSIGVVTFSEAQKELINDVLGSELARHPHSGSVITDTGDGIFVTDAGSLRSRDRDTIVMSLLIGKDPSGRLTTDLSPFSRADGEKVLKDAVSCANRNVMVFSSLRPDDLADNETNGIKALRSLLEYTEKGMPEKEKKKNELRAMISKAVAAKGYEVHENVGLSDAAVDIGVVDPEYKDRYILGILLDNGAFMMSDAADTEFVLKNMLEERGWALHHVWTTDWMNGREKETERIVSEIKKRLNEKDRWTPRMKEQKKADIKIITKVSASGTASRPAPRIRCVYKKADLEEKTVSLEALFSNSSRSMIERDIIKVIETESPVADTAVAQRLADAYGLRISPKLLDHLTAMIANVNAYSTITPWNSRILWKEMQSDHDSYRVPAEGDTRNVKEIAAEEITNAIIDIITAEPDILADDLIASVASLFGAGDIDSAGNIIAKCIDIAIEKKMIKRNSNGNVSLYIV